LFPFPGSNLCLLSLDPHESHRDCAIGFTFTVVICSDIYFLTAFTLCFELYSSRVPVYVLFPPFVEEAKISHQLSVHLCTNVTHLSNTKIVASRSCTAWNISADMTVSVHASGVQHKRSGLLIEPSVAKTWTLQTDTSIIALVRLFRQPPRIQQSVCLSKH